MFTDAELVGRLLIETENDSLDFKRDQYPLDSAEQKGSFTKDIIAMANVPRREPAYILIGVREENGRAVEVVGTTDGQVRKFL